MNTTLRAFVCLRGVCVCFLHFTISLFDPPPYPTPHFQQHCHQNIQDVWVRETINNITLHDAFWSWWSGENTLPKILVDGAVGTNKNCFGTPYEAD